MRLSTIMLPLAGLIARVAADELTVLTHCGIGACDSSKAMWHSMMGQFPINANEGCRDPPDVPSLNSICFDWGNGRAHFYYDNQPKRCLQKWTSNGLNWPDLSMQGWKEVTCTW